jgi:hypothetical protein
MPRRAIFASRRCTSRSQTRSSALIDLAITRNDARTISRFEAASPRYAFLNRIFAVGASERDVHTLDELL